MAVEVGLVEGTIAGVPPDVDLQAESALQKLLVSAARDGVLKSAHDCAEGGLAVALAECVMMDRARSTSASVDLSAWSALPLRALLFGEAQGRVIVSTSDARAVHAAAAAHGVRATTIGRVTSAASPLSITIGSRRIQSSVVPLADAYHEAIPRIMSRAASAQDVALASDSQV